MPSASQNLVTAAKLVEGKQLGGTSRVVPYGNDSVQGQLHFASAAARKALPLLKEGKAAADETLCKEFPAPTRRCFDVASSLPLPGAKPLRLHSWKRPRALGRAEP